MGNRASLLWVLGCACTVSGPSSLPAVNPVQAGDGIKIDANNKISVDPATANAAHATNADQLGGVVAASYPTVAASDAKYLAKTAQAADSAKLGGVAPTSFAVKDSGGNVDLGSGRVVLTFGTGASAVSTSAFGLFCGQTATTFTGNIIYSSGMTSTNGYQGAKKNCEAVAGCGALAHMCTPAEMIASLGVGAVNFTNFNNTALWVASGVHWDIPGTPGTIADDCIGYTSASATAEFGAVFIMKPTSVTGNAGIPGKSACSNSNAIACCQ